MGARTFQKVVRLGLKNERSRREESRRQRRLAVGAGEEVSASPADKGVWGSVVSSSSRVRGGAPAANAF